MREDSIRALGSALFHSYLEVVMGLIVGELFEMRAINLVFKS